MNVAIVYLRVVGKTDTSAPEVSYYEYFTKRFHDSYISFRPKIEHELIIVNCGTNDVPDDSFDDIATQQRFYTGTGWDIGAYQDICRTIDCDLAWCMATPVHFWRSGWLDIMCKAVETYGPGVYGPQASFENSPHIRTGCFAFHPKLMRDYPVIVDSRMKCCQFESLPGNFSHINMAAGHPVLMVTEKECYSSTDWRKPDNIFRRGDQSNCIVWDRYNDLYFASSPSERELQSRKADGL